MPIGIDESLRSVPDLLEYVRADAIGVAVAKVQRNAGLYRSRQLCDAAEAAGLELSLSGLTETDLGLAAGLHLAAAFDINPLQLNGPQYIETDYLRERVWRGGGRGADGLPRRGSGPRQSSVRRSARRAQSTPTRAVTAFDRGPRRRQTGHVRGSAAPHA